MRDRESKRKTRDRVQILASKQTFILTNKAGKL